MPDSQIHPTGTVSAPADYVIPSAAELLLKMAYAKFDGTAAASSFKPCLRIISDAGTVAGEAVADDTVAAGGSADVTWFPHLAAPTPAAASPGVAWFFASRVTNQSIAATTQKKIQWTHVVTSDSTVFTVSNSGGTNSTVLGHKAGVYAAFGQVYWDAPLNYPRSADIITDFFGISPLQATPASDTTSPTVASGTGYNVGSAMLAITQAVPGEISLSCHNWDVAAHNIVGATYAVAYWPNSTLVT
jgi:hypothetical protein